MPTADRVVLVRCELRRGGFPHDRVFVLRSEDGRELRGVAQVQYCYTRGRAPLGDEPRPGGAVAGYVAGLAIGRRPDGAVRVYLPDSDVYELDEGLLEPVGEE